MTRHKSKSRKPKKIPKSLKDKARKLGIRLTTGQKTHVPKSEKVLRTQITNADKKKKDRKRKYRGNDNKTFSEAIKKANKETSRKEYIRKHIKQPNKPIKKRQQQLTFTQFLKAEKERKKREGENFVN